MRCKVAFFFFIFNTCQSCKRKTKLIKVNEECIFLLNFLFLLIFPSHTNSTDLVLRIKNTVKKRNKQAPKMMYKLGHGISEVASISEVTKLARC